MKISKYVIVAGLLLSQVSLLHANFLCSSMIQSEVSLFFSLSFKSKLACVVGGLAGFAYLVASDSSYCKAKAKRAEEAAKEAAKEAAFAVIVGLHKKSADADKEAADLAKKVAFAAIKRAQ